jgi:hypothetical protein
VADNPGGEFALVAQQFENALVKSRAEASTVARQ